MSVEDIKGLKVLVVDDTPFMRELIIKLLNKEGCEIVGEAKNGEEAISMYQELRPQLVTMDINMPILNGLQAIKRIMEFDYNANIIVVTGHQNAEKKAMELGAKEFLLKPFQPAFLYTRIHNLLESGAFDEVEEDDRETLDEIEMVIDTDTSQDYHEEEIEEVKIIEVKFEKTKTEEVKIEPKLNENKVVKPTSEVLKQPVVTPRVKTKRRPPVMQADNTMDELLSNITFDPRDDFEMNEDVTMEVKVEEIEDEDEIIMEVETSNDESEEIPELIIDTVQPRHERVESEVRTSEHSNESKDSEDDSPSMSIKPPKGYGIEKQIPFDEEANAPVLGTKSKKSKPKKEIKESFISKLFNKKNRKDVNK